MKKPVKVKPLSFPVPFPDVPLYLLYGNVSRQIVTQRLGPPMLTDRQDGVGLTDFWAFEYPCGLQVAFECVHECQGVRILADAPEIDHVLRHIPLAASECSRIGDEKLESELRLLMSAFPERRPSIETLHAFQVWRQGDDGNAFKVGEPTSERDAKCRMQQLESLGHKQTYWYSPTGTPS